MVGYYRQYIEGFATIVKPLSRLVSKGIKWDWDGEAHQAFTKLRQ